MNATSLLSTQHRKVEALFKKLENGRADHAAVLDELANSLAATWPSSRSSFIQPSSTWTVRWSTRASKKEVFDAGVAEAVPKGMAKTSADVSKRSLNRRARKTA